MCDGTGGKFFAEFPDLFFEVLLAPHPFGLIIQEKKHPASGFCRHGYRIRLKQVTARGKIHRAFTDNMPVETECILGRKAPAQ